MGRGQWGDNPIEPSNFVVLMGPIKKKEEDGEELNNRSVRQWVGDRREI